jgi:hypothetical protein
LGKRERGLVLGKAAGNFLSGKKERGEKEGERGKEVG